MSGHLPILFDRALRPEWLDFALASASSVTTEAEFREILRHHLQPLIPQAVSLRKTVMLLQRTVGFRSPLSRETIAAHAQELLALAPDARTSVRLRLLISANPFVADCVTAMLLSCQAGQSAMDLGGLTERIERRYGQRGSVARRVRYVLQSLTALGGVAHEGRLWRSLPALFVAARPEPL